jgi:hypothetical protein
LPAGPAATLETMAADLFDRTAHGTALEELTQRECLRLARTATLGRFAVVVSGRPLVFPVNFVIDDGAVVLRTGEGSKLEGARSAPVAFECDAIDRVYHTGWSVLISGDAEEVRDAAEIARLEQLPIGPWCEGPMPVWLRIRPRTITGRRIPLHGSHPTERPQEVTSWL